MRASRAFFWTALLGSLALIAPAALASRPLDLSDTTPRWVEVRFEVSPPDEPGRLHGVWSSARRAYLEPDPEGPAILIRVPSEEIEGHLRTTGTETVPGTFSEFVWTLDPETGHVVHAELRGRVRETVRLGPIRTTAEVEIHVEMTTHADGGFQPAAAFLGQRTNRFCTGTQQADDCVMVAPSPLDPASGYVNAIGSVIARTSIARFQAFSPLGEALFFEQDLPAIR